MNLAGMRLFFTVYKRPEYFEDVLSSWAAVKGIDQIPITFHVEPSRVQGVQTALIKEFADAIDSYQVKTLLNSERLGVLRNPFNGFTFAFDHVDTDYAIIAEEDLLVSNDILEFHAWARRARDDSNWESLILNGIPGAVCSYAHNDESSDDHSKVDLCDDFSPWVWGTWKDVWLDTIAPTWDFDYTSGIVDGVDTGSGWDWNLDKRVFPKAGLRIIKPRASRSQSIGIWGQHGNPANHKTTKSFISERPGGIAYSY